MPSASKTLAKFDLLAEISKARDDHGRSRSAGTVGFSRGAPRSLEGRESVKDWAKSHRQINKGVHERAARDMLDGFDVVKGSEAQKARAILTEKAKYYEKLRKGQTAGLTPGQISSLMVDFDAKSDDEDESDSDDENEASTNSRAVLLRKPRSDDEDDPNDPIVEYQDEFGRTRTARRSRVPRSAPSKELLNPADEVDDRNVYVGDQTHFGVYEPTPEELAARRAARGDSAKDGPLNVHYDANSELRDRGAAHRVLAKDEATRAAQRAEFDAEHERIKQERAREAERQAQAKLEDQRKREDRLKQIQAHRDRILAKRKGMEAAEEPPEAKVPKA